VVVRAVHECYTTLLKETSISSSAPDEHFNEFGEAAVSSTTALANSAIEPSKEDYVTALDSLSFKEYIALRSLPKESAEIQKRRGEMSHELHARDLELRLAEALSKLQATEMRLQAATIENQSLSEELEATKSELRKKDLLLQKNGDRLAQMEASLQNASRLNSMEESTALKQSKEVARNSIHDDSLPQQWQVLEDPAVVSEEDAKGYISRLNAVRRGFEGSMRTSMSGALRELGADLYADSTHFLHEMIQNADDCTFPVPEKAAMEIIVTSNAILLCSNERGFLPKEILAICNLAASSKSGRDSTGQKGVGFKSSYSCTNSPHIVSGSWSFRFEWARGSNDNMGAITPIWTDKGGMPQAFQDLMKQRANYRTFFYLPIRPDLLLPAPETSEFLQAVFSSIDQYILLNTRRIRHLNVTDARLDEATKHDSLSLARQPGGSPIAKMEFEGIDFFNVSVSSAHLTSSSNSLTKFISVEAQVLIPSDFLTEAEKISKKEFFSRVSLSFPDLRGWTPSDGDVRSFPVYCTLPIADFGFRFILNAAWHLVTSRDNASDKPWNLFLAGAVAKLFVWATVLCPDASKYGLTENLGIYLPDDRDISRMSKEKVWRKLVTDIQGLIRHHLPTMLLGDSAGASRGVRLLNKELQEKGLVVDWDAFENISGFRILGREAHTHKVLQQCRQQLLEPSDILDCMDIAGANSKFSEWVQSQESEWWQTFFTSLLAELNRSAPDHAQNVARTAKSKALFHLDASSSRRAPLPETCTSVRCCDISGRNMTPFTRWWRMGDGMSICFPKSSAEHAFLTNSRAPVAPELSVSFLAEHICASHLMNPRSPGTKDAVVQDLTYLYNHQEHIEWSKLSVSLPTTYGSHFTTTAFVSFLNFLLDIGPEASFCQRTVCFLPFSGRIFHLLCRYRMQSLVLTILQYISANGSLS
jgi:hypothetical protein